MSQEDIEEETVQMWEDVVYGCSFGVQRPIALGVLAPRPEGVDLFQLTPRCFRCGLTTPTRPTVSVLDRRYRVCKPNCIRRGYERPPAPSIGG